MSSNIAQNRKAFEWNLSSVTALCSWLLVMLKQHLELHLQLEASTHNVITVSVEREEEWEKKSEKKRITFRPPAEGAKLGAQTNSLLTD